MPDLSSCASYLPLNDTGCSLRPLYFQRHVASLSAWETTGDTAWLPASLAGNMLAFTEHDESSPWHDRQADKHKRQTGRLADRAWNATDEALRERDRQREVNGSVLVGLETRCVCVCVFSTWKQAQREMRGVSIVLLVEGKLKVSAHFWKSDFTVVKPLSGAANWL